MNLVKDLTELYMSYDRLAPTISSKAKKLFGSGNMGQNNGAAEIFLKIFPVEM